MKLRGTNKVSPEFSMSSMTDIVFLLLIFFMLTSNAQNTLDLLLPKAKGKATNNENVSVSINRNLQYYINAQPVSAEFLETELKRMLKDHPKPTIILRAEESVPVEHAVLVMDIANRNNYKVVLAVRPK
ncbi:ExbD/TolR family protein [Abyssalbus ytuae]|uniref:Biopolymer transporter ExbD n=1 Tax=Abyssalbus ytuae TaxID=2926907 RepID=A0A9E6ZWY7_9FLAO|nr:biopolymer transporter ExbD [Abyssalbus ytuae]UOB16702.1 biopolymer transporter ExbD [Abyssalbus ytuae]